MTTLQQIAEPYLEQVAEENAVKAEIEKREKEIEKLNEKLKTIRPFWVSTIIHPIANELAQYMHRTAEILGPFGLTCQVSVYFHKKGAADKFEDSKSITFRPVDLDKGVIGVVNKQTDTRQYAKGTVGDINDMNHPTVKLGPNTTIKELLKWVK